MGIVNANIRIDELAVSLDALTADLAETEEKLTPNMQRIASLTQEYTMQMSKFTALRSACMSAYRLAAPLTFWASYTDPDTEGSVFTVSNNWFCDNNGIISILFIRQADVIKVTLTPGETNATITIDTVYTPEV